MSQWLELQPTHGNVPGSISGQGLWVQSKGLDGVNAAGNHTMCLSHIHVSLFLFLLFPSKNKKEEGGGGGGRGR